MPDDDGVTGAERINQRKRIARQGLLIRVAIRNRAGVIPAHERTDRAVPLGGDSRSEIVPGMRRVREPVKHEHQRSGALLEIGESHAVRVDEMNRISHGLRTLRQSSRPRARMSGHGSFMKRNWGQSSRHRDEAGSPATAPARFD